MAIQALGYVGIGATAPDDWAGYGTSFLGLRTGRAQRSSFVSRMDDRRQRIVVTPGDRNGARFFGWEVADAAALEAIAARLQPPAIRSRVATGRWPASAASPT